MTDLHSIEKRIRSTDMIHGVVLSMRALAATHLRHGAAALEHLRDYENALRAGLSLLPTITLEPPSPKKVMMIVLGSDQGLCGPLTQALVQKAQDHMDILGTRCHEVLSVGERTTRFLETTEHQNLRSLRSPSSLQGVGVLVEKIADRMKDRVGMGTCDGVDVVFTHHSGTGGGRAAMMRVYPVRRERLLLKESQPPVGKLHFYEEPEDIAKALLAEWTYISIYRAAVESLTAEHAARLVSTDSATRVAEKKMEQLRLERNQLRQAAITEELLEIVSAAEA